MSLQYDTHAAPRDLVFVHGAGGTNLQWRRILEGLGGSGGAFAVNLPGHPSGEISCRSIEEYAEVLHQFVLGRRIEKPVICGHSMGGAIALTFAVRYPGEISGLILVDTGAKLGVLPSIRDGLKENPLVTIQKFITPMSFYRTDAEILRESVSMFSIRNPAVFLNDYDACNSFDIRAHLSEIAAKTLIICGEYDQMTPPKWSHYLNTRILNSAAFFIRDAGHMVPLEKPNASRRLINDFLLGLR